MQKTALYEEHKEANGKIIEFCGWQLPINYGSQIKEHNAVRTDAGMFDVSHMTITDISGNDASYFLRTMLTCDVNKLVESDLNKACYAAMLNEGAGIIDDLIIYYVQTGFRLITNASTSSKVNNWLIKHANNLDVVLQERKDLSIIALQGPNAIHKIVQLESLLSESLAFLKSFTILNIEDVYYARTGYTGEDGLEIILPHKKAVLLWQKLIELGVTPCGLAARDTLRLEAGLNLYGHDMDENINPLECNMGWTVDLKDTSRNFIGKDAYLKVKAEGAKHKQVGLISLTRNILREGQSIILDNEPIGVITSGTFSPTLNKSIGIGRIKANINDYSRISVDIRGKLEAVKIVKLPFVRNGKQVFTEC